MILASRFVAPRRLFPVPLNDPALFTATPRRQAFLRAKTRSRCGRRRPGSSSRAARLDFVMRRAVRSIRLPLLLLLAGKDRIIDNAKVRAAVERCPTTLRRVIEYPEAHHTLEFEEDPTPTFADLRAWLDAL